MIIGDTIFSWLLATLLLLALLALTITIRSWREMKRSRYYFMRRQAEQRVQAYSLASLFLLLGATATSVFAFQTPADNTVRVAILSNTKPPSEAIIAAVRPEEPVVAATVETVEAVAVETRGLIEERLLPVPAEEQAVELEPAPALAEVLSPAEPATTLEQPAALEQPAEVEAPKSGIGTLQFSTEIGQGNQALNPSSIFGEGFYTLYATFDYADMADGTEWSWIWRRNGDVFDRGAEIWNYGRRGLGYIYLNPTDGFQNGKYELEVWVEDNLLSQSSLTVNSAAVTAGN